MRIKKTLVLILVLISCFLNSNAQDPNRFKEDVEKLENREYNFNPDKKRVVFTGSSSIAMWHDVQEYFPDFNVINNGFGGSHFSDLIYFYDKLILKPAPEILFIYEGDNDIEGDKKPAGILKEAKFLVDKIQNDLPDTKIVLITPKPSIARWELKKKYEKLNKRLAKLSNKKENVELADVWNIMLDENGLVYQDIFLEDNLHMNKKGYDLWDKVISDFLE